MSEIAIILVLILLNGLFSMSEIALVSARKTKLSNDIKKGSKLAKIALKLANEPDKFLSTIQIGITSIGILTGIYSGSVLAVNFSKIVEEIGVSTSYSRVVAQVVIVIVVTYLSIIFGELVPKRLGMSISEKIAKIVARPMNIISAVASPFVWILSKSTSLVFNLFGIQSENNKITEDEIRMIIQEGIEGGEVQEVEQNIVERVFLMGDLKISSIMTPRNEVVMLNRKMTSDQVRQVLEAALYNTYPVVEGDVDHVRNVIRLKDLVLDLNKPDFSIDQILKPATYFYENISVYKVLEHMKEAKLSYALICDEFGNFIGIITLKNILEGLVGSLDAPHEEPEIIKRQDNDGWLVDGQCALYNFLSYFKKEELYSNYNFNTLSGLILETLQHIPKSGEKMKWNDFVFEIVDMDGVRIDKILVTIVD